MSFSWSSTMAAKIIFRSIDRRVNDAGVKMAHVTFDVVASDSSILGTIGVPDAKDATVWEDAKRCLRRIFLDGLNELGAGPPTLARSKAKSAGEE
jgi:hypothetical protein